MALEIQRESTEWIFIGQTGDLPSGATEVAFVVPPARPTTWETAILVDDDEHELWDKAQASGVTGDYFLARLIGDFDSNDVVLDPEDDPGYQAFTRVTDPPTRPVRIAPVGIIIR